MTDLVSDIEKTCNTLQDIYEKSELDGITAKHFSEESNRQIKQLLKENQITNEKTVEVLCNILEFYLRLLLVPQNDSVENIDAEPLFYANYIERTEMILPIINDMCNQVLGNDKINLTTKCIKNIVILVLHVCGCHSQIHPWNNKQIVDLGCNFMDEILSICKCESLQQLMDGNESDKGFSKNFFCYMMPKLKADNWKKNTSNKFVFKWCLYSIKYPNVIDVLPEVLAPSLVFADDSVLENKIIGVKCLHYIIQNVNPTELRMYGRADVIFDALFHLLYSKEAELINILYPCLMDILPIVNQNFGKVDQGIKRDKCDKVFNHLLSNMAFEQKLVLRNSYIAQLSPFINLMGISVVKHMKVCLAVIFEYLENYSDVSCKRNTLLALITLIKTAWPRIPSHMKEILKNILKFAYDLQTEEQKNDELSSLVTKCLILLRKTSPQIYDNLCEPLYDIEVKPIKAILKTVLLPDMY